MAIYHFSAKIISRANGSSALASAAYRSASRLHDQRLDRHHDFSNKTGVVHSEVLLPDGAQIMAAGEQGRAADHQAWGIANQQLGNAIQSIDGVVASARAAEMQRRWIAGAAAAALVIGFTFGTIIPTWIAQAVPESWHWSEANAARILQRDSWAAGERLLQVSDPVRWKQLIQAARIAEQNADALAKCRENAAKVQRSRLHDRDGRASR